MQRDGAVLLIFIAAATARAHKQAQRTVRDHSSSLNVLLITDMPLLPLRMAKSLCIGDRK